MIAVVQRVSAASVTVAHPPHLAEIQQGLLVYAAIEPDDGPETVEWMANKLVSLRIFPDADGKMNLNVSTIQGEILLISQFTLAGNCDKGHRPSFIGAAPPDEAAPMIEQLAACLREKGTPVETGVFGAEMSVKSLNEGPVTLILRR